MTSLVDRSHHHVKIPDDQTQPLPLVIQFSVQIFIEMPTVSRETFLEHSRSQHDDVKTRTQNGLNVQTISNGLVPRNIHEGRSPRSQRSKARLERASYAAGDEISTLQPRFRSHDPPWPNSVRIRPWPFVLFMSRRDRNSDIFRKGSLAWKPSDIFYMDPDSFPNANVKVVRRQYLGQGQIIETGPWMPASASCS